jgi:hypothetical protein
MDIEAMRSDLRYMDSGNLAWIIEQLYAPQTAPRMLEIVEVDNHIQELLEAFEVSK